MNTETVQEYYSNVTGSAGGQMQTTVCHCGKEQYPLHMHDILRLIPDEIEQKAYGCGSPVPLALEGCTVLDLGCGTGRDVYLTARLVGPKGKVIGLDMNEEQLHVARKYQAQMTDAWGYSNVSFLRGNIEDLVSAGIADHSVDVVISNCVLNLAADKERVFREIWRVLKFGGELYFSDIFADRRVPEEIGRDPVLLSECMGGAMYVEDFRRMMRRCGWEDFRYVSTCPVNIDNPKIEKKIGNIHYTSRTVRAMKLPGLLEDICEQYGQVVTYLGGITGAESAFDLDDHHHFEEGLPASVCGNTCAMLQHSRFSKHFLVQGDRSRHFGPFPGCGTASSDGGCCEGGCCC